jgi:hypothetical protein
MRVRPDSGAKKIRLGVILTESLNKVSAKSTACPAGQRLKNLEPAKVVDFFELGAE